MITEEQRENRKEGIYASDISRIMTGGSVQLVLEKIGEKEPEQYDDNLEIETGRILEDKILDAYQAERPTVSLVRDPKELEFFHPEYNWLGCHPDARAIFSEQYTANVEVKAIGDYNRKEWGDGGDDVPPKILWQVLGQMAITQDRVTELPVCFLNVTALKMLLTGKLPPITIFRVEADQELQDYIIQRSQQIWTCIQTRELPAAETIHDVNLLYRRDTGATVEADEETFEIYKELIEARQAKEAASELEDAAALKIKVFMEDASELRYKNQRLATWKKDSDSTQLDGKSLVKRYPKASQKFIIPRIGPRKFLPKVIDELKKEKE